MDQIIRVPIDTIVRSNWVKWNIKKKYLSVKGKHLHVNVTLENRHVWSKAQINNPKYMNRISGQLSGYPTTSLQHYVNGPGLASSIYLVRVQPFCFSLGVNGRSEASLWSITGTQVRGCNASSQHGMWNPCGFGLREVCFLFFFVHQTGMLFKVQRFFLDSPRFPRMAKTSL